jgi:pyruvate kinase
MRRAKIVATLGPATSTPETIRALVDAGMDVARLNLSHGSHDVPAQTYRLVRSASDESGRSVGILVDLQGPKIRLGTFAEGAVLLNPNDEFIVTTEDVPGDANEVSTTYKGLPGAVEPLDKVLVDDGRIALEVVRVEGPRVVTRVVEGGRVSDNKGFNLPGAAMSVPALSDKD